MRILTIEFPGSKRPIDYGSKKEQDYFQKQVEIFASSLYNVFLQNYFAEEMHHSDKSEILGSKSEEWRHQKLKSEPENPKFEQYKI